MLLFILTNVIIYVITQKNQDERINLALDGHLEKLQTHYEILLYHQKLTADAAYKSTISNNKVIEILTKAQTASKDEKTILRNKLLNILKKKYEILKLKGVLQYQFNFPDNKTFLRVHKPSKFGDDLKSIRYSYNYTNKTHKSISGLEQGKTTHGFRNVYPVFNKDQYLGAMEISFSSELLQGILNKINKIHTHFIVDKHVINVKAWKRDDFISTYDQSNENENFMMTKTKNHNKNLYVENYSFLLSSIKEEIDKNLKIENEFNLYVSYNDNINVISFLPIKNIKDKKAVAWLVSYEYSNFIKGTLDNTLNFRIYSFIVFLFLYYFIYRIINQKKLSDKKVEEKTAQLKNINDNLEQRIKLEVEKNQKVQKQLFKSEKMASMGEMIGNIAHQWRQPLSVISTGATGLQLHKEYDSLTDDFFDKTCETINDNAQYLSKTIDDFKNFIKGDSKVVLFNLSENINSFLHIVDSSVKNHSLNIILELDDNIKVKGYPNELIQSLINIFNNSKDVLKTKNDDENRYIFISTKNENNKIIVTIKDNAEGIPKDILPKIFDPYFTTKHKSQGTGLGLHMTYNLIVNGMKGTIEATTVTYDYNGNSHRGAEFKIILPVI